MNGYILPNIGVKNIYIWNEIWWAKLNDFLAFFKKYFDAEYRPLENLVDINNISSKGKNHNRVILNNNNYNNSKSEDDINTKPPNNEEAALPAFT